MKSFELPVTSTSSKNQANFWVFLIENMRIVDSSNSRGSNDSGLCVRRLSCATGQLLIFQAEAKSIGDGGIATVGVDTHFKRLPVT